VEKVTGEPLTMVEAQRSAIVEALRYTRGDMSGAAWFLGIGRATIYRKVRDYEIMPEEWNHDRAEGATV
jgi:transcriptional regulator of acetoin/glycerol metabolism